MLLKLTLNEQLNKGKDNLNAKVGRNGLAQLNI